MRVHSITKAIAPIVLLGALSACASLPPPNDKIVLAQTSIERAERAGAVELAPIPIRDARDKLSQAKQAISDKDNEVALRLAEKADSDAQLAEALAQTAKADKSVADLNDSLRTLQNESRRSSETSNPTGVPSR